MSRPADCAVGMIFCPKGQARGCIAVDSVEAVD